MGSSSFDTISMVDSSFSSFRIHVEPLQVVVKVDVASAQVATEQGSVGSEDGSDIDAALLAEGQRYASKPFVKLRNDGSFCFVLDVLPNISRGKGAIVLVSLHTSPRNQATM